MKSSSIQLYLNKNCYFLNQEEIYLINKNDSGSVSNVINKLCPHSFGIWLEDGEPPHKYYLFYINNEHHLTGLICKLDFSNPLRNDITYVFSSLVNKYFPIHTRFLRVFNNYQTQTITLAEKFGYCTYGDEQISLNKNDTDLYIPFCDKIAALKVTLNHITFIDKKEKNDYIYLMYNSRNDLTKIGRSINPLNRERTLQGEDPELAIIGLWKEKKIHEKILHNKFKSQRKRGEWFDLDIHDFLNIKHYMDNKNWL